MMKPKTPFEKWLNFESTGQSDIFVVRFEEHHIGNPLIRSLHGGIVGAMIENMALEKIKLHFADKAKAHNFKLTTSNINFLRVTKDADLYGRCEIIRIGKRIAFLKCQCWQDNEETLVANGNCVIRIL